MVVFEALPLLVALLLKHGGVPLLLLALIGALPFADVLEERFEAFKTAQLTEAFLQRSGGQLGQVGSGAGTEFLEVMESAPFSVVVAYIVFAGLFRPLPFDINNALVGLAAIENTILLILFLKAFRPLRWPYLRTPVIFWTLMYSVLWAAAYGIVVLGNFGAGMRYKLQALPFMLLLLFLLLHPQGRAAFAVGRNAQSPSSGDPK
jgi:hypothetical protein